MASLAVCSSGKLPAMRRRVWASALPNEKIATNAKALMPISGLSMFLPHKSLGYGARAWAPMLNVFPTFENTQPFFAFRMHSMLSTLIRSELWYLLVHVGG